MVTSLRRMLPTIVPEATKCYVRETEADMRMRRRRLPLANKRKTEISCSSLVSSEPCQLMIEKRVETSPFACSAMPTGTTPAAAILLEPEHKQRNVAAHFHSWVAR